MTPRSLAPCWLTLAVALCAGCGESSADGQRWTLVFEGLDAALISVSGTSHSDVWAVGSNTGDGAGALVLHYDGQRWSRERTGVDTDLWWVHAQSEDRVWMSGADGAIVRYDGERFERMDTPGSATAFGIWGATDDDVWAVGGEPEIAPGFVWHYDGSAWSDLTHMLPEAAQGPSLFKVWGRHGADVWFVGMDGLALHWDGSGFEQVDAGTSRQLFTVHGAAEGETMVAVGGFGDAVIVEHDGTRWHNITPDPAPQQLFGVHMLSADHGFAVGWEGSVLERSGSAWKLLDIGVEPFDPFHAVWVDPEGGVWAVGGELESAVPSNGMLLHRGEAISNAIAH